MDSTSNTLQRSENLGGPTKSLKEQIKLLKEQLLIQEDRNGNLEEKAKQWEKMYNKKREEEARRRKTIQDIEKGDRNHTTRETELSKELETVMKSTLAPIVAAVIMKAVYKEAAEVRPQEPNPPPGSESLLRIRIPPQERKKNPGEPDNRAAKIRKLRHRFLELGYENNQQVVEFGDTQHFELTPLPHA
ncbi:hypothetical protein C7212DRAFT_363678 [Tuber magnatum]|uniref:Uncharacterized protein n=1 Tax=Tuber magnatum TaxID=42249 RepID=A0A317SQ12_9PEZI|nr:hypothetical protein C7212DRAFT_363678 [Tuber magnatum]